MQLKHLRQFSRRSSGNKSLYGSARLYGGSARLYGCSARLYFGSAGLYGGSVPASGSCYKLSTNEKPQSIVPESSRPIAILDSLCGVGGVCGLGLIIMSNLNRVRLSCCWVCFGWCKLLEF